MKKTGIAAIIISVVSLCLAAVCMFMTVKNLQAAPAGESNESTSVEQKDVSKQYVVYVGTNDKDTYAPKYTEEEAKDIVDNICLKYFDGYTLQEATGSWVDEKNNVTHEYTIVCYFDDADSDTVHKAADEMIKALNQNSLLIEENDIQMEYYSG